MEMTAPVFDTFDVQHLTALALIAAVCLLLAWKVREGSARVIAGRAICFLLSGYVAFFYIQQGLQNALTWEYSLPLDLCNLVLFACIVSLFKPNQFATEISYFWGMGGVLQAAATPDIARGFPSWDFILFFWGHGATLIAILFLISGREFRPRRGSVFRMMAALNAYGLAVGTMDAITGWNYGYLCRKPSQPSLLDFLGPWPWYLLSLEAIGFVSFLILDLPWRLSGSLRKRDKALTNGG
jgi:hypothetical integral membrane protein (TIGR02206 family)